MKGTPPRTSRQRLRLAFLRAVGVALRSLASGSPSRIPRPPSLLLIRPDHLGDLLFLTPALRWLRERLPEAHITLLVGPWGREIMQRNPHVDEVITCSFPGFTRQPKRSLLAPYRLLLQEARKLRRQRFDLSLVMRFDHWWGALLAAAAGIPYRLGYAVPEVRPFLTQAVPYVAGRHEVEQNLRFTFYVSRITSQVAGLRSQVSAVEPISWTTHPLEFAPAREEEAWVEEWLLAHGAVPDRPLVAIHPGAGATVKLWEDEKWAAVADALAERREAQILLTGSADELDLVWAVAARTRVDPLMAAGETTLGQLAALYRRCRLVIGPDCGPLHLAVAVGTPSVHLYGPVDAGAFGPWGNPFRHRVLLSDWPCVPCNRLDFAAEELPAHPCVRDIGVQQVLAEAESLLAGAW
ncbi:MAG: glycosyltransferase family 9 protein [Chloroflexi bacterium]|nr:glycosyltransferase family 9 protein [Chloroflexota bacterium]